MPNSSILHAPASQAVFLRGVDRMAALLRPTLGPIGRTVVIARLAGSGPPEILDSAALIARRTLQLADPFEDMGAMLIRHLAWRVFERAGDGSATAAVLAQSLLHEAVRHVAAGANSVALKRGVELGLAVALHELRRQARAVELPSELAGLVAGVVHSPRLAELIGEVVESVGPDGAILVEDSEATETTSEHLDGVRWNQGYVSHFLLKKGETSIRLYNPRVLITDHTLESADQLIPTLEACVAASQRSLLIVAPEVRDSAVGLLLVNRERGVLDGALAVTAPLFGAQRSRALEDLAVITGARCLLEQRHDQLGSVTIDDLGQARQAWATRSVFGLLGGHGSRSAIRQRVAEAKAELSAVEGDDYTRDRIKERIGKLAGSAAIIRVGAPTRSEQEHVKPRVEAAVRSAQSALQEGVVPGAGAALLACLPALAALDIDGDEVLGVQAVARALTEPLRVIVRNAGLEPGPILHEASRRGPPWAFDALRREWVDPWSSALLDPLPVTLAALETAVSAAGPALTANVLIHRKNASVSVDP